eukprot:Sdes_comp18076_c0_seq1m7488
MLKCIFWCFFEYFLQKNSSLNENHCSAFAGGISTSLTSLFFHKNIRVFCGSFLIGCAFGSTWQFISDKFIMYKFQRAARKQNLKIDFHHEISPSSPSLNSPAQKETTWPKWLPVRKLSEEEYVLLLERNLENIDREIEKAEILKRE